MANESVTIVQSPNSVTVTQSKNTTVALQRTPQHLLVLVGQLTEA
jgi:hypothetical protein